VREMLALLLEGEGHRTTTAEDGRKALELAARGVIRPDLVIADFNLPKGLNGLQVVAGLRETLGYEIRLSSSPATSRPIPCARSPTVATYT